MGHWHLGIDDECCGICRNKFEAVCVDCEDPGVFGEACPPVWGQCDHCFHMHCILKWIDQAQKQNQEQVCPMCRAKWAFKGEAANDDEEEAVTPVNDNEMETESEGEVW